MRLTPDTALLADSGKEVPTSAVKAGDVLLVKPGARVPLDGVVTKGESSVNEAMLTGESLPVEKAEGSEVIGGSVNENGVLYVKVTRVGEDTTLSRIIRFVEDLISMRKEKGRTASASIIISERSDSPKAGKTYVSSWEEFTNSTTTAPSSIALRTAHRQILPKKAT